MKFTAALLALAAVSVNAGATTTVTGTLDTKKVDAACENIVTFKGTINDAHAAKDDTVKFFLPPGVFVKDGAQTITTDYILKCKVGGADNTDTTAATYSVEYSAKDHVVTAKKLTDATGICQTAGVVSLQLKKACVLVKSIDLTKLKVANSKTTGETGVASTTAAITVASDSAAPATLKIASTIKKSDAFSVEITPKTTAATTQFLTVYIPGYTIKAAPTCKIGTKAASTIAGSSVAGFGYIQITGATDLWTGGTKFTLSCAAGDVTAPTATQAASKLYVVMGATAQADAIGEVALPAVATPAPTRSPTRAPTRAFSAAPSSAAGAAGFAFAVMAYFLF